MNRSELTKLITTARAFDDRVEPPTTPYRDSDGRLVLDPRIEAWMLVLGDIDASLALQGLAELYREPQMLRLQPGHIRTAAEKVRRRNVASADLGRLTPPDELAEEEGTRSPEWKQAAVRAIGLGATVEEASAAADEALGVTRRTLGPPVRRLELERRPRGLGGAA
ncbi:hypothetical protein GCM10009592_14370 [Brachybacterium rhamnosum]|uniref:DUF222 domain-containing protein n=1 Tax=Brachybacterium rhamnosum TaxID=173361 RepID=A0ABW4PW29_9MICO